VDVGVTLVDVEEVIYVSDIEQVKNEKKSFTFR